MSFSERNKWAFMKDGQIVRVVECTLSEADDLALEMKQFGVIDSWTYYDKVKDLCQVTPATH